ncbi:hypothetical protein BDF20DRAFT_862775 [Mycotypha africana]|uniref:uncharacterized protein n=1 Tax=Mycotypha africana TaxID=64632 RepID=UPI0023012B22|nr:uncharacterized protein BDF20DRAFT_862775 [Mycotypha africana]KAI8981703.1 hypothetical protein BDF20DRAFT_862775 [Mycotypha africana]
MHSKLLKTFPELTMKKAKPYNYLKKMCAENGLFIKVWISKSKVFHWTKQELTYIFLGIVVDPTRIYNLLDVISAEEINYCYQVKEEKNRGRLSRQSQDWIPRQRNNYIIQIMCGFIRKKSLNRYNFVVENASIHKPVTVRKSIETRSYICAYLLHTHPF